MKRKNRQLDSAPGNPSSAENLIPFEQIDELVDFLERRGLEEFELERAGLRIRIRRRSPAPPAPGVAHVLEPFVTPAEATHVEPAPSPPPVTAAEEAAEDELHVIRSPIVGTFYPTPAPDAPPFVKAGDVVQVGQVLCIIEAMKLMNEIEADVAGEIVRIYPEYGQPVEYGQPLFAIRPSRAK